MELRHLRYFVAVAEEGHMTRAAQRLEIQQPPLSKQIQQLEEEIGVTLFTRSPRKIVLNAAGKMFLSDARRVLAMAQDAVDRVRQFDLGGAGSLRVGFTSSSSLHEMTTKIIEIFRAKFPLVSFKVEEGANHDLLHMLEQERLDIAFVRGGVERYPGLASQQIVEENLVVALPAEHELARHDSLALEDIASENIIIYRQQHGSGIGDMLLAAFAERQLVPRVVNETHRLMATLNMVGAGFGLTVVPSSIQSMRLPAVAYRPLMPEGVITAPLNVAYRKAADTEAIRRFLQACDEVRK